MIEIDRETAVRFLQRDLLRHVCIPLNEGFEDGSSPARVFADSSEPTAIMVAPVSAGDYNFIALAGYDYRFTEDAFRWLMETFGQFRLTSHDKRVFDHPEIVEHLSGPPARSCSWACDSLDRVPEITDPRACSLTIADMPAALRYPAVRERGPNLPEMLETEEVFGIRENGEILGFLAACQDFHNIWDVDIVHVREDHRRQGLATALAAMYARAMLTSGRVAYYSGASEASGKAAENAGFFLCRELFWSDMKSNQR